MGYAKILEGISFAAKNLGKVTPVQSRELVSLDFTTSTAGVDKIQCTVIYNPSYTSQRGVTWSIVSGNDYADIDSNTGVINIKESGTIRVRVTSSVVSFINKERDVDVIYPPKTEWTMDDVTEDNYVYWGLPTALRSCIKLLSINNESSIDFTGDLVNSSNWKEKEYLVDFDKFEFEATINISKSLPNSIKFSLAILSEDLYSYVGSPYKVWWVTDWKAAGSTQTITHNSTTTAAAGNIPQHGRSILILNAYNTTTNEYVPLSVFKQYVTLTLKVSNG